MADLWELPGAHLILPSPVPSESSGGRSVTTSVYSTYGDDFVIPPSPSASRSTTMTYPEESAVSSPVKKRFDKGLNAGMNAAKLANRARALFTAAAQHRSAKGSVNSLPDDEARNSTQFSLSTTPLESPSSLHSNAEFQWHSKPPTSKSSKSSRSSKVVLRNGGTVSGSSGKNWKEKLGIKRSRASSENDMQAGCNKTEMGSGSVTPRKRNRSPTRLHRHLSQISGDLENESAAMKFGISELMIRSYVSSTASICDGSVFHEGDAGEESRIIHMEDSFATILDVLETRSHSPIHELISPPIDQPEKWTISKESFEKWMLPLKKGKELPSPNASKPVGTSAFRYLAAPKFPEKNMSLASVESTGLECNANALQKAFQEFDIEQCLISLESDEDLAQCPMSPLSPLMETSPVPPPELRRRSPSGATGSNSHEIKAHQPSMRMSVVEQLERLEEQFHRTSSLRKSSHAKEGSNKEEAGGEKRRSSSFRFGSIISLNSSKRNKTPRLAPVAVPEQSLESLVDVGLSVVEPEQGNVFHKLNQLTLASNKPSNVSASKLSVIPPSSQHSTILPNTSHTAVEHFHFTNQPPSDPQDCTASGLRFATLPRKFQERVQVKEILPNRQDVIAYALQANNVHFPQRKTSDISTSVRLQTNGDIASMDLEKRRNVLPDAFYPSYPAVMASTDTHYSTNTMGRHRPMRSNHISHNQFNDFGLDSRCHVPHQHHPRRPVAVLRQT